MTETPPPNFGAPPPPPAAPAKRRIPVWVWIVGGAALLCVCVVCAVVVVLPGIPAFSGAMAGGQLVFKCTDSHPDLGSQGCNTWVQQVVNTPEFQTCISDLISQGNLDGDTLYNCLEEKGVGPG